MSLIVSEVYDALIEAGVTKEKARAAAEVIPHFELLATKEDVARLEHSTKEDIARLERSSKENIARLELSTKEDIARLEKGTREEFARLERSTKEDIARLDKKVAVLNLAVLVLGPAIVALLTKLVFFP